MMELAANAVCNVRAGSASVMRGKRRWCTKSSSCHPDQPGRTTSALFHELETGKSSLDPQLLNWLDAVLIANFFDYVHAAKMLIWADNG